MKQEGSSLSMKHKVYEINNFNLDEYHLKLNAALFHNANGYIGIRYDFEEGYTKENKITTSQYINGFYDYAAINQAEKLYGLTKETQTMLNIADTQTIKLLIDDEEFSMFQGTVLDSKISLNMDKGTTVRDVLWRSEKGNEMRISITRMTSFFQLPLFTIEYEVEPINFSGNVVIQSIHDGNVINYVDPTDPRIADECPKFITPTSCEFKNEASYITSITSKSRLSVCSSVKNVLSQECQKEFLNSDNQATCIIRTKARKGEKFKLVKYAVFCDSIRNENYKEQAALEMKKALAIPLNELYKKQEEYLKDYWENCFVEIDGDEELDMALKFNLYQLLQSVSKDEFGNIAPKGLSGDGYEGHFFWDSEMYIQPFFTITSPTVTSKLIEYRYKTLDMARENARILGHSKGALYPWRTIMGKEASGYFPAGSAQYHINGDIAYSIIAYYLATKDINFIIEKGAEIIIETARLWIDTGNFQEDKFYINTVTGPDEYTCIVNNNYYTNVLAQYHLNWAVKFYYQLKEHEEFIKLVEKIELLVEEIESFKAAADRMYLPFDETLKINPQDDSFLQKKVWNIESIPKDCFPLLLNYHPLHIYRHQICKQADTVMAHFILEDAQSEEVMRNSFLYYEKITTHDSSLSKAIFSIMAAKIGMEEKSFAYFGDSAKLDLNDKHKNTDDGIHVANMAGSYLTVVYGFAGFRLKERGISFAPMLPKKWREYRFKITYENSRILVHINESECIFCLEKGEAKKIYVYEEEYLLDSMLIIKRSAV